MKECVWSEEDNKFGKKAYEAEKVSRAFLQKQKGSSEESYLFHCLRQQFRRFKEVSSLNFKRDREFLRYFNLLR